ncbi:MAG: chromosomal replication initiator protein DnaA [Bacilli bacterium]|nr:chromosomal replication initiator protein DnaA [Bacilli bacterium]
MNLDNIWNELLKKIEPKIKNYAYEIWFSNTKLISLDDNIAKVLVTSPMQKKNLQTSYIDLIQEIFTEITGSNFNFNFVLDYELDNKKKVKIVEEEGLPINNLKTNLDSRFTFDNFIIGNENKFAATSALAVAEQPGNMYNPLFIYGSSGLGKTHLMHAIGNYIVENSNKKVLYTPCDKFVNEFVEMSRKNKNNNDFEVVKEFKNKYRNIDVLIIDDIHNLVGSNYAQQEFFNTFNELKNNNKQIIMSSDRSPDDIKKLEERLKTRFNGGLTTNIQPPEFELRMNIINKKLESQNLVNKFSDDVKEFIASNSVGDIRKIEGAITRVYAYAAIMNGEKINLDLAKEALKDFFVKSIVSKNKIDQVIQLVADHYSISPDDLKSKKKTNNIAIPRQIAMYICRTYLEENLMKIGMEFGGKNHTTVMHAVEKIKKEINNNDALNVEIQKIINNIR